MSAERNSLKDLYSLLAAADKTFRSLPPDAEIMIRDVSKTLQGFGCRTLSRKGHGMEFYEAREFNPQADERRRINRRLSLKAGKDMIVDRQIEIPHHVYIWRDPGETLDYASRDTLPSKRMAAEIMALSLGKHLVRNEDAIGILNGRGTFRSSKTVAGLGSHMTNVSMVTGNVPSPGKKLPRDSTVVLFSDFASFLPDPDRLNRSLDQLVGQRLHGHIVMVLDPEEIDFSFRGPTEFHSIDQQEKIKIGKAESLRDLFRERVHKHIEWVRETGQARGFDFTLQRTDNPLHEGLLRIFGLGKEYTPIITPQKTGPFPS